MDYSIGITTYSARYNTFLIDLLSSIRSYRDNEIILAVNGDYKQEFNKEYRQNLMTLIATYDNVFPVVYPEFRALAKLWNTIVINSTNEYVLILNDDVEVTDVQFFEGIETAIKTYKNSFKINNSFSHFVIKKEEIEKVGWFDERFLGIGWEDWEFSKRYKLNYGREFPAIPRLRGIVNHVSTEDGLVNQCTLGKYSKFNHVMYEKDLEPLQQYPYESFYRENKNSL